MITALHKALSAKRRDAGEQGFTLIELLVVVLIIGILAAIAIPIFVGQQNQAKDSAAQSDLGNAKVAMISYAADHTGSYAPVGNATTTASNLGNYGYTSSTGAGVSSGVEVKTSTSSGFCLQATSGSTQVFSITNSGGVAKNACA